MGITPIIGEAAPLGLAIAGSTEVLAQLHPGIEASIHRPASAESGRLAKVNRLSLVYALSFATDRSSALR